MSYGSAGWAAGSRTAVAKTRKVGRQALREEAGGASSGVSLRQTARRYCVRRDDHVFGTGEKGRAVGALRRDDGRYEAVQAVLKGTGGLVAIGFPR